MSGNALVPELSVTDLQRSLDFYCGVLGFTVRYGRPAAGFAFLEFGAAQLMLDQLGQGRDWMTAPAEHPFGRGMNLQILAPALDTLLHALAAAAVPLFQPLESKTYQVGEGTIRQRQFCVQDADSYLLRFFEEVQA